MVKQFNFNKSYAEIICSLPHKEAGVYVQRICGYMFRDTEIEAFSTDKIGCLLSLAAEDLAEEKQAAEKGITVKKERHFAFKSAYANVFLLLKDGDAGILIKQVCDYMFGGETVSEEETKSVNGYFTAMKKSLQKSKNQAKNARKKVNPIAEAPKITLDEIKQKFNLSGNLREGNPILDGVSRADLHKYLQETPIAQNGNLYKTVEKYREERMKNN